MYWTTIACVALDYIVDCSISCLIRISSGVRINFVIVIIEGGLEDKE